MKSILILTVTLICIFLLIVLQFLQYAFLPAIDPKTIDKADAAFNLIMQTNIPLILETFIGLILLYWINNSLLKRAKLDANAGKKINLLSIIVTLIVVFTSMLWFSWDYYFAVVI